MKSKKKRQINKKSNRHKREWQTNKNEQSNREKEEWQINQQRQELIWADKWKREISKSE